MKTTRRLTTFGSLLLIFLIPAALPAAEVEMTNPYDEIPAKTRSIRFLGGANAFSQAPLTSKASLRAFIADQRADIEQIFDLTGWPGDPEDFFKASKEGVIEKTTFPVGTRLHWMALRRGGKNIDVLHAVRWQGKGPFKAFVLRFSSKGSRWAFVVPKACGNLALLSRMGEDELTIVLTSGVLELVDPEGNPIIIKPGDVGRVSATYSDRYKGRKVGKVNVPTSVHVIEGTVEFSEYDRPVSVLVTDGNEMSATLSPEGKVSLAVPDTNTSDLPIKIGDAFGYLKAGVDMAVNWPAPICSIAVRATEPCVPGDFEIDASESSIEHGSISSVDVTAKLPDGAFRGLGKRTSPDGFLWTEKFDEPGTYLFTAVATSDDGVASSPCSTEIELKRCIPPPPVCQIELDAAEITTYGRIKVDASKSASDGGTIRDVEVNVYNAAGRLYKSVTLQPPFTGEIEIDKKSTYTVQAIATDNFGQKSYSSFSPKITVKPKRYFSTSLIAGLGNSGAEDGWLGGLKMSYDKEFIRSFEFALGLGAVYDEVRSRAGFFADITVDRVYDGGFVGFGLGLWDISHSDNSTLDLIIRGGLALPFDIGGEPVHVFAEGRLVTGEPGGLRDGYRLLAGLRLRPW